MRAEEEGAHSPQLDLNLKKHKASCRKPAGDTEHYEPQLAVKMGFIICHIKSIDSPSSHINNLLFVAQCNTETVMSV